MKTCSLFRLVLLPAVTLSASAALSAQSPQLDQARRLVDAEKYAEAQQILRPMGGTDASAAFLLGKIALIQNDAPAAVDWLEKSVAINPRSSEAYDWLGKAYGTQAQKASKLRLPGLAKKTKNAWEKAVALDPNNLEAKEDMITYYLQAPGFLGGSKEKAKAVAMDIRSRNSYRGGLSLVQVCGAIKDEACVEREFRSLAATYPDSANVHGALAAYYANAKQYDKAFAVIDARLKTKPADASALYALGRTASISGQQLERGEQALRAYIAAPLPKGPAIANAHYRLGLIAEKKGDRTAAKKEYQQALALNPKLEDAKKALAALGAR
ncbi:MAG TPA: tetratricopeptide repeat protein [Gemmatimonadaceae bacterium]|nr:tetratricopeptide repeat protein [Gemmatimonadaceae bacterium]